MAFRRGGSKGAGKRQQFFPRANPKGDAEQVCRFHKTRLELLFLNGAAFREGRESVSPFPEGRPEGLHHILRGDALSAADPSDDAGRDQSHRARRKGSVSEGDQHLRARGAVFGRSLSVLFCRGFDPIAGWKGKPKKLRVRPERKDALVEECSVHRGEMLLALQDEAPSPAEQVRRGEPRPVAGAGGRERGIQGLCAGAGQVESTAQMSSRERNDHAPVLGDADERRIRGLVPQERCGGAQIDGGGADPDDAREGRPRPLPEGGQEGLQFPRGGSEDLAVQGGGDAPCRFLSPGGEHQDDGMRAHDRKALFALRNPWEKLPS